MVDQETLKLSFDTLVFFVIFLSNSGKSLRLGCWWGLYTGSNHTFYQLCNETFVLFYSSNNHYRFDAINENKLKWMCKLNEKKDNFIRNVTCSFCVAWKWYGGTSFDTLNSDQRWQSLSNVPTLIYSVTLFKQSLKRFSPNKHGQNLYFAMWIEELLEPNVSPKPFCPIKFNSLALLSFTSLPTSFGTLPRSYICTWSSHVGRTRRGRQGIFLHFHEVFLWN